MKNSFCGAVFIGSHVCDQLSKSGYEVKIFDIKESPYLQDNQKMFIGDILDHDSLHAAIRGSKYVYNFAGIAEIKETLKHEGILDNTLIIFTSDNGGATYTRATNNSPYYGGKMSNFEGGTVVPMMIQWKGKIKPQKNYTNMVSLLDIVLLHFHLLYTWPVLEPCLQ